MTKVAAILLAAGRSERMGAFKPLLPFGEKSVIQTCIDNLRRGGAEPIIVVLGHRSSEVRQHLQNTNVTFAFNEDPASEMSTSIACGAEHLPPEAGAVIISLTDQPAIPSEVIAALIDAWRKGAKLIIPEFDGRGGHPVLLDLGFKKDLFQLDPKTGLKGWCDRQRHITVRLPVNSPFIARDLDTWDDYTTIHNEIFGVEPSVPAPGGLSAEESN